MTNTISPNELKPGDRVRVTFEGTVDAHGDIAIDGGEPHDLIFKDACHLVSIERLPPKAEPLKVGEEVDTEPGVKANGRGEVIAIVGNRAWIDWHMAKSEIELISNLHRNNGIPISTGE